MFAGYLGFPRYAMPFCSSVQLWLTCVIGIGIYAYLVHFPIFCEMWNGKSRILLVQIDKF